MTIRNNDEANLLGLEYRPEEGESAPERRLLAAVILQTLSDCNLGSGVEAVRAYKWIERRNPMFVRYCNLLGYDPEVVRDHVIEKFADKIIAIEAKRGVGHSVEEYRNWREAKLAARRAARAEGMRNARSLGRARAQKRRDAQAQLAA